MTSSQSLTVEQVIEALRYCAIGDAVINTEQPGDATVQGYFDLERMASRLATCASPSREPGEDEAERVARAIFDDDQNWDRLHADYRQLIIGAATRAIAALTLPEQPRPVDDVERMRAAIEQALHCTPSIRYTANVPAATIVYDCGDPWEILRAALGHKDRGGE